MTSNSLITKKIIAKSLKTLMITKSFEKISVSDIMADCQIRRQTFYSHFQDKYELIEWIFKQEAAENIEDNLSYERWTRVVLRIFEYLEDNRVFYRKALEFEGQNSFKESFSLYIRNLLVSAYQQIQKNSISHLDEFELDFYTNGFVEMTVVWVLQQKHVSSAEIAAQLIMLFEKVFR